jgi:hypothetical protein
MTDHFISFPAQDEPLDSTLTRLDVKYAVLYDSPVFPKIRWQADSLYRTLMRRGTLLACYPGITGDIGRDYFRAIPDTIADTLLLFKLR